MSFPPAADCRCRGCRSSRDPAARDCARSRRGDQRRHVVALAQPAMRSAPGNIEAGSSRAIRTFAAKAGPGPRSVRAALGGRCHWARMTTSSAPTRRPASRPAARNHPTLPPAPGAADARRARVRPRRCLGLSGRLGRPSRQGLRPLRGQDRHRPVRASRRAGHEPGALPLGAPRLLDHRQRLRPSRPEGRRAAARPVAERHRSSTRRSMPVGSTRSRSTSRSSSARSSRPTTSPLWPNSKSACSPSRPTTSTPPSPFQWTFTRRDLQASWPRSPQTPRHPQPDRAGIRHRNSEPEY